MTNKSFHKCGSWILAFLIISNGHLSAQGGVLGKAAVPRRISSKTVDLGKVQTIHMVPGMATLVEIPDAVTGIRIGDPDSVHYFQPKTPNNEVTLVLQNEHARPTNLIIRSGKTKYVFDIVPSKTIHQDTIEIIGSYGGAIMNQSGVVLLDSSDTPEKLEGT